MRSREWGEPGLGLNKVGIWTYPRVHLDNMYVWNFTIAKAKKCEGQLSSGSMVQKRRAKVMWVCKIIAPKNGCRGVRDAAWREDIFGGG